MLNINILIDKPELFEQIKAEDIDDLSNQFFPLFKDKINSTADYLTNKLMAEPSASSKEAFEYRIKDAIKNAMYSYVAHEKWKIKVPIQAYISKSVFMFARSLIENNESSQDKIKIYVCPACKERKIKEILDRDEDVLYCKNCNNELSNKDITEEQKSFYKCFSKHSIKGIKCPNCNRFVPISAEKNNSIICPYPGCHQDCNGSIEYKHPVSVINRTFVSINNIMKPSNYIGDNLSLKSKEFSEQYCGGISNVCDSLIQEQEFANKFAAIKEIIELQKKAHGYARKIPNKVSMYEAFANILNTYPEEMVKYLTVGGQNSELSIQATIYQEFAKIMQTKLPIKMYSNGNLVYIDKPTDEKLHLFTAIREFVNFVDHNSIVKRRNEFVYNGNDKIKDEADSFIGQLISVKNVEGEDLSEYIDQYNFTGIKFKFAEKVKPGTDIFVKYYSILPNYSMKSMIHLQRIKKKISDSINRTSIIFKGHNAQKCT